MNEGMSLIVRTIARWVVGFIFLYGIYTLVYGHLSPGGGFASCLCLYFDFNCLWQAICL